MLSSSSYNNNKNTAEFSAFIYCDSVKSITAINFCGQSSNIRCRPPAHRRRPGIKLCGNIPAHSPFSVVVGRRKRSSEWWILLLLPFLSEWTATLHPPQININQILIFACNSFSSLCVRPFTQCELGGKPLLVGRVIVNHPHSEHAGMMLWSLAIAYHAILSFRSTELRASFTLHSLVLVPTDRPHVNPIHVAPFQSITIVVPRPFLWSTTTTLEGNRVRLNIAHWDQETEMICGGRNYLLYFVNHLNYTRRGNVDKDNDTSIKQE